MIYDIYVDRGMFDVRLVVFASCLLSSLVVMENFVVVDFLFSLRRGFAVLYVVGYTFVVTAGLTG